MENIKELVLKEAENGFLVVSTFDGLKKAKLSDMVGQSADGLLYDLNRDTGTILTLIDDPKWINDYACNQIIRYLKKELDETREKLDELIS